VANQVDSGIPKTNVTLKEPAKLSEIADHLKLPLSTIRTWNPELINDITPPSEGGYPLRLQEPYMSRFASIEPELSFIEVKNIHMHRVANGETLSHIARKYKVKIKQILDINPNLKAQRLRIGHEVAIPVPSIITHKPKKLDRDAA
jgi:membrane-bound lytic murein transglycosylase D